MADPAADAKAALIHRQGTGARYDSADAPTEALLMARRGTAYFARKLNELTDIELDKGSKITGWSRRHVIAHVSYHARALTRLIAWGKTGIETPMYPSIDARDRETELGATLPARALRHLFQHSEVHLNVCWRDIEDVHWKAQVHDMDDNIITLQDTVLLRARVVWTHAIALGHGGSLRDIPMLFRSSNNIDYAQ